MALQQRAASGKGSRGAAFKINSGSKTKICDKMQKQKKLEGGKDYLR